MSRPPQPGDLIADRYELEELVGTGGMSTVFRAYDRQLERRVAIKILHEHYADDPEYLERFRREARAVAKLSHPNIVTVIDRGDDGGRQYIVFEHVEGENLKELVVRSGRLPVRAALELALDVANGLAFAHDHGLVHRDVKPQNVLLSREGEVKVTDFGIARSLHMEHGVTQTGTVLGTGEYLAPEQASGKQVSPATDVYSLGVVLWELLAGDVPFVGENFVAVALRHVNEPPPSLRERRPDVTPRLEAAVDRALAKDPGRRFPSMAAFAKELRACLAEAEGEVAPPPAQDDLALTLVTPPAPAPPARAPALEPGLRHAPAGARCCTHCLRSSSPARRSRPSCCSAARATMAAAFGWRLVGLDRPAARRRRLPTPSRGHPDSHADTAGDADGRNHVDLLDDADVRRPGLRRAHDRASGWSLDAGSAVKLAPADGDDADARLHGRDPGRRLADAAASRPTRPRKRSTGTTTTFTLDGQTAQYYVVWITQLPAQLYAQISEVTARS